MYLSGTSFLGLGTNNPGRFVVNNASSVVELTSCSFANMGISTLRAGVVANGTVWRSCGQITANAATLNDCTISGYTGATDTSALVWNDAVDPNGELDGTTFVKGTGTTHAIEFGTSSPTTMTLTNVNFSGYGTAGSTSAAVHIKRTTGTVTLNISGGSTPTIKSDGATVTVVNAVTVGVTVKDAATSGAVSGARVRIEAASGGSLPAGASISITRSGSTATVTHTAHGLATNDWVIVRGAAQGEYNGDKQITVTGTDTYTYTVSGTPTTPATGTITSTYRILNTTTDGSGVAENAGFVFTGSQPIVGAVRKGTATPLYRSAPISGTIDGSGFSTSVFMTRDD